MHEGKVAIGSLELDLYSLNTVVVGSGAAGFNAADCLYTMGQKDIAIVTEGIRMGTSRNTGSDKQTYYKLSVADREPDSVEEMADTLFKGGAMHGDIALIEAALSAQSFFKLTGIGVPFPHNRFGEYVGYQTDHDLKRRASSSGPLTSRHMTDRLEDQVRAKEIKIFDRFLVIGILTEEEKAGERKSVGLLTLNMNKIDTKGLGFTLFNCTNIVYATGGPAGMYLNSVYPESQTGALGTAFEAGVAGVNLTESQYGIASVKFRWNLSGTYQQVLPRYVSVKEDGSDEKEFLQEYFENPSQMLNAVFLKGYQWPFDPRKIENFGSSCIDLLVYYETQVLGRKVFLDFTQNPSRGMKNGEMDFSLLNDESFNYLQRSKVLFGKPIDRLRKINSPAIKIFSDHGIDLASEWVEIAVCAQHNNGGLKGSLWWESNVRHFFPVGEANGTFGIYRPGGSALNSTQTGSYRAAQFITAKYSEAPLKVEDFKRICSRQVEEKYGMAVKLLQNGPDNCTLEELKMSIKARMSRYGAHIRSVKDIGHAISGCMNDMNKFHRSLLLHSIYEIPDAFRCRDMLLTQYVFFRAIEEYMQKSGSRGGYVVCDSLEDITPDKMKNMLNFVPENENLRKFICEVQLTDRKSYTMTYKWEPVRTIPERNNWFEQVWNDYLDGNIIQ